jgi:hypothetical protein
MGAWKTDKGIVISDGYADCLEKTMDEAWLKLKEEYPKITKEEFAETVRFILNRFSKYKEGQIAC